MLKNRNVIIYIFVLLIISFMSVGYAYYGQLLEFSGNINLKPDGKFRIDNIILTDTSNVISSVPPIITDNTIEFNISFGGTENEYYAIYTADFINESSYSYTYNSFNFTPIVTASGDGSGQLSFEVSNINDGDVISPGEILTITLKLILDVSDSEQTYDINAKSDVILNYNEKGSIFTSVSPLSVDLTGTNELALINLEVMNTYGRNITFNMKSSNNNFSLVNSDGTDLGSFTILANSVDDYQIYLKKTDNSVFYDSSETTILILQCGTLGNYNTSKITVSVDKSELSDTSIPEIGEISFTINNNEGQADLNWSRLDSGGTSIIGYTILLYNSTNDTLVNTYNTNSDLTSYSITGLEEGSYYVKIYGTDQAGNNGSGYVNDATTSTIYCRQSSTVALKWIFNVTNNLTYLTSSGASTASLGSTYTATLSVSGNVSLPTSITVTMNGVTLVNGTDYTYSSSTGQISIPNVNGDITITARGSGVCLIEGTKISLADGSTKNIENIRYDDLLLVWSYEEGRMVYEYPIWIEKEHKAQSYQLTKFSSGDELKTIGYHGIYNMDLNRFVSVDNREEFDVGTNVAIMNDDKTGFISTSVVSIEYVYEEVNYYHVVSTRYYNIIANNILTTDGTVILSNLYGFDDNIMWLNRNQVINDKNNLYDYIEFNDIMPYYMFSGLRASEGKYLANLGFLSKETFKYYLLQNQMNKEMLLPPTVNKNGIRQWVVKTSLGYERLIDEGSYFYLDNSNTLGKKILYWYDMSTGVKYKPNERVKIWYGTYFEAIYE
ncbi:MAG: hypothetical protein ACI33S_06750 [Bacilli bacterium]